MRRFYKQTLCIPHNLLLTNQDLHHGLLETVVQRPFHEDRLLAPGTRIASVFDEHIGQLLVVGAPGSGKTTLLLELAEDLINRAETNAHLPIPIVLNLSSWSTKRRPLAAWLVDEMNKLYDIPRELAQAWLDKEQILPLLDGLDEVARQHREACVEAINAFRKEHGFVSIVVCSRMEEYETLAVRLRLPGAVAVQPLVPARVKDYLDRAGEPLKGLREALDGDPTLWEPLDTPLMLNIAMFARLNREFKISDNGFVEANERQRRDQLFAKYVDAMFQRRARDQDFTREQTILWLARLASFMNEHSQNLLHLGPVERKWQATQVRRWTINVWSAVRLQGKS